jgi:hypothetical protein
LEGAEVGIHIHCCAKMLLGRSQVFSLANTGTALWLVEIDTVPAPFLRVFPIFFLLDLFSFG